MLMKKVFFYCLLVGLFFIFLFLYNQPRIAFVSQSIHLSLYEEVKPKDYIKSLRHIDKENIDITHNVDNKTVGKYKIKYMYKKHAFSLDVYVDDTLPPHIELQNKKILINTLLHPMSLVSKIKDDSTVSVRFKEDYVFDEAKTYRVTIIAQDSYKNVTEKSTYVLVEEKDNEAPVISNIGKMTILMDDEIDLKKDVKVTDDFDLYPSMFIDDSSLNIHKIGEYSVFYHIEDQSGNKSVHKRIVEVLSRYDDRPAISDNVKTCYLTFDDGPSQNTPLILDILRNYGIKATFFVSGTSPKDFAYIKEAHNDGHAIGLHCYNHDYEYVYKSLKNYVKDLNKIKEEAYKQTGVYSSIVRFPGGSSNLVSKKYNKGIMKRLTKKVIDLGYQYFDWTSINGDGENIKTVSGLKKKAIEEIKGKEDIMFLMHDSASCINTVKALPDILDYLIKEGYTFEIVNEYTPTFHHTVKN